MECPLLHEEPTLFGHRFLHWSLLENGPICNVETSPISESITYYAVFEAIENVTISIDDNQYNV